MSSVGAALAAEAADLMAPVRPLEERCPTTGVHDRERPVTLTVARAMVQRGEAPPPRAPPLPPLLPPLLTTLLLPPLLTTLLTPMLLPLPSGLRGSEMGRGGLTPGRTEAGEVSRG